SAQPPPKYDDRSSKKPRESGASATKQHPALSSTGWQITNTGDAGADSSMHRSDPESEHSEQSSGDLSKQDKGNVSNMEDTDYAHIPKNQNRTGQMHTPQRLKLRRKTSYKGRRMIWGRSSNCSADELERRSSAKLI
ncbi:hypothetical protein Tco_0220260, partial [Tanacetum coccineum]